MSAPVPGGAGDPSGVVVAVDIGGTKIAAGIVGRDLAVRGHARVATPARDGSAAIVAVVAELVTTVLAGEPGLRPLAVGIGTAGTVDVRAGRIVAATDTLRGWAGTDLAAEVNLALASVGGPPVVVQNDVDAHAWGEAARGAAAGYSSALVVAVGTGIGAGILIDTATGQTPLRGAHHGGGDLAHVPASGAEHLRCTCGWAGHLEAIGSGIGLHQHYVSLSGDRTATDAREVAARATAGNAHAARAIAESAAAVGRGIAAAVAILDPAAVVVSGSVPSIGAAWWEPMVAALRAELTDDRRDLPVLHGALGGDAPLVGAAAHAWAFLDHAAGRAGPPASTDPPGSPASTTPPGPSDTIGVPA
ncbi:ROK family protein [Leucobacter aridicollis]|uniref:ROK family protein n=1 Tax=Leucobacter aridicollis TaxID=283878 RepID=UPI002166E23A|nr:ROK family protein [Leucobacter aridicollis]MCS3428997.1 glucokinase [Leucobacter aridicollis]